MAQHNVRRSSKWGKHDARVAWLVERPKLALDAPSMADDVDEEGRALLDRIAADMVKAGILGAHGQSSMKRESVRIAIGKARAQLDGVTVPDRSVLTIKG